MRPARGDDFADGSTPFAGLVQDSDGNLYGTTSAGGANSLGTIYKLAAGTHAFTKLADLSSATGGAPYAPLVIGPGGWLYGTASLAGKSGDGTIFRVSPKTGKTELPHAFSGPDGAFSFTALTPAKADTFYGVTLQGGLDNRGVVFAFTLKDEKLTVLHQFTGPDGSNPQGALALDDAGNLLGTTFVGGTDDSGVIYRYNPSTHLFQVLQNLTYGVAGEPNAGLTYAGGKVFFGGTQTGGSGEFATGAIIKFSEP